MFVVKSEFSFWQFNTLAMQVPLEIVDSVITCFQQTIGYNMSICACLHCIGTMPLCKVLLAASFHSRNDQ